MWTSTAAASPSANPTASMSRPNGRCATNSKAAAIADVAHMAGEKPILIAVATKGGERINEHFGHAKEFQIYEVNAKGAKFVGHRRVDLYCEGGSGDEDGLGTIIQAINDCVAVFVAKIGGCPKKSLEEAGIDPVDRFAFEYIEEFGLVLLRRLCGATEFRIDRREGRRRCGDPAGCLYR